MTPANQQDPAMGTHSERAAELERRIEQLEALDESAFGGFTAWDWLVCVIGALLVPAIVAWWFAG
jgi:hypothetical protein